MTDFFDWLTANDSGLMAERLANAFKLSHEEMRRTTEALGPAYSIALQRTMSDPFAWSELWSRFTPFLQTGREEVGGRVCETLFGREGLASAIARQASMASGIAPDVVEKLMQDLSVMTVQAMLGMMVANMARNQPAGLLEGDYPGAVAEMMRRGANAVEAMGRPSDAPARGRRASNTLFASDTLEKLFADTLKSGLPWLPPAPPKTAPARREAARETVAPPSFDPFLPLTAMLDGIALGMKDVSDAGRGGEAAPSEDRSRPTEEPATPRIRSAAPKMSASDRAETESKAPGRDEPSSASGTDAPFDAMARETRRIQEDYAREMMALFQRYQDGMTGKSS